MNKHTRKFCAAALGLALLASLLAGCKSGSAGTDSNTLRVGVRSEIMNFGYQNKDTGRRYGMEIDLAKKLANDLGYEHVTYVGVNPETRQEKLSTGEVDCLIACYSISESRKKEFDFSDPYYTDNVTVMVQKTSLFRSMEDLKGRTIGVLAGTNTPLEFASKMNELGFVRDFDASSFDAETYNNGFTFFTAEHYADLSIALEKGEVDAVCMDGCIAQTFVNDDRTLLDVTLSEQQYGVATVKDSDLSSKVQASIQKMNEDGTITRLLQKWGLDGGDD